jgi:hypothetical protein
MRTTGMTAAMAEVAFHACWLQHAANEHRREDPESRPPFLSIVQRLAARPEGWTASRGT